MFKVTEDDQEHRDHGRVRYEVFVGEKGWITPADLSDEARNDKVETDEYDPQSRLIVGYNLAGEAVAAIRVIEKELSNSLEIPIEKAPFNLALSPQNKVGEVSRLAVLPPYRSEIMVTVGLYRAVVKVLEEDGIDDCYGLAERPLHRILRSFGFPFEKKGDPRDYLGGKVMPIQVPVCEMASGVAKAHPGKMGELFTNPFCGVIDKEMIS